MADPITIAAVATALGAGLGQVGKTIVEKGLVEPALKPAIDTIS